MFVRNQGTGAIAAYLNALIALCMLGVTLLWIGPTALSHPEKLTQLAIEHPAPLVVQDLLKIGSAMAGTILWLNLYRRIGSAYPRAMRIAISFGAVSILSLLINAGLSLFATQQAARPLPSEWVRDGSIGNVIGLLGMSAIFTSGVWYLLMSWCALRAARLPTGLSVLGLFIGGLSLLPPLGLVVLLLNIVWLIWLGRTLARDGLT